MMKGYTDRRTVLVTVGAAAVAASAGPIAAQSTVLRVIVTFEGGTVIPKGHLEINLKDLAAPDNAQIQVGSIQSYGRSKAINISLSQPAIANVSPNQQIIVRLEREDGWLLARGSAQVEASSSVYVQLSQVMY
jgi:hypothetical protein